MLLFKQELNALLWADDVPEVPKDVLSMIPIGTQVEKVTVNIQCIAHTIVATGYFMKQGFRVTTRGGMAFVAETSPDGDRSNDLLNQIVKHWWLSLDGHGLVDLSLHGTSEHPLIYCNRNPEGRWRVEFGEDRHKLDCFLEGRQQGCFYLTLNKRRVSHPDMAEALAREFPAAKKSGVRLPYATILEHCERVLAGTEESLAAAPQAQAWQMLAQKTRDAG